MYSNSGCSCSFEPEIIKTGLSSHKMYSNSIVNFQVSTTILNACTKKSGNLLNSPRIYIYIYICTHIKFAYIHIYIYMCSWCNIFHVGNGYGGLSTTHARSYLNFI